MVRIRTVLTILAYAVALLGYLPLSPYLETVPRLVFPVGFIVGIAADREGYRLNGRITTAVSLLLFILYAVQFRRDNLVDPAVNLLSVLLAIRMLSEKNARNFMQIYLLSLFSLAGSSLFSLSPLFLLYLGVLFALLAISLVILTFYSADSNLSVSRWELRNILSTTFLIPVTALPLMLVFFVILPRTQYPLWKSKNMAVSKETGFSEKVELGTSPGVDQNKNVAFRALSERLAPDNLYWRGIVLNSFAGNAWIRREPPTEKTIPEKGKGVVQTIFPEPGKGRYLVALNVPRLVSGVWAFLSPDFTAISTSSEGGRVKYDTLSIQGSALTNRTGIDREFYLTRPERLSARIMALGKDIAERGKSEREKIALLEDFFVSRRIVYATTDLPVSGDPLDEFLFEKKRGNCEFFATSCALLLRIAGVPARLVGGYFGGEYNELGGYYVVTEDMAHVWVEAFVDGRGWVKIDPSRWAANFPEVIKTASSGAGGRFSMAYDAFDYYWNLMVITYDLEKQVRMVTKVNTELKRLTLPSRIGRTLLVILVPLAALAVAVVAARRFLVPREERILRKFFGLVHKKFGIEPDAATGLHELAVTIGDPSVHEFVSIYAGVVYRDRKLTTAEVDRLYELLRAMGKAM